MDKPTCSVNQTGFTNNLAAEFNDSRYAIKVDDADRDLPASKQNSDDLLVHPLLMCHKCHYSTVKQVLLDNHVCSCIDNEKDKGERTLITITMLSDGIYNCSECNFSAQGHAFEEHVMCHIILRPYQCLYCSQCFISRREIGRHLAKQHQGKKLNCALRALKRAKCLINSVFEKGSCSFLARVPRVILPSVSVEGNRIIAPNVTSTSQPTLKKHVLPNSSNYLHSDINLSSSHQELSSKESVLVVCHNTNDSDKLSVGDAAIDREEHVNSTFLSNKCKEYSENELENKTDEQLSHFAIKCSPVRNVTCEQSDKQAKTGLVEITEFVESDNSCVTPEITTNSMKSNDRIEDKHDLCSEETSNCAEGLSAGLDNTDENPPHTVPSCVGDCSDTSKISITNVTVAGITLVESGCRDVFIDKSIKEDELLGAVCDMNVNHLKNKSDDRRSNVDMSDVEKDNACLKIVATFSLENVGNQGNMNDEKHCTLVPHLESSTSLESVSKPCPFNTGVAPDSAVADECGINDIPSTIVHTFGEHRQKYISTQISKTLGPSSKPVPSSSFLGLASTSITSMSQVISSSHVMQRNSCFFVCGFQCGFSSLTSLEFRDHLLVDHSNEVLFTCFHCGYHTPSVDGLVRHISAHAHTYSKSAPLYICGTSACKFGSNLLADFVTHLASWHPDILIFQCHDCDERFCTVKDLLKHFEANFLHIINCPHCTAKSTERRALLDHIAAVHPGKPKMVSVAKQIVCRDRKINGYSRYMQSCIFAASAIESMHSQHSMGNYSIGSPIINSKNKSLVSIFSESTHKQGYDFTNKSVLDERRLETFTDEYEDDDDDDDDCGEYSNDKDECCFDDSLGSYDEEEFGNLQSGNATYMGSKANDKEAYNFRCKYCTFIARDKCRLDGHEKCHSFPPSQKSRFKCMYCPHGFINEPKFNSHVCCHPGLIKFNLFSCKNCDYDTNQRHVIVNHVRYTRDQAHRSAVSNEDDMYSVIDKTLETRVMECARCSYMTRHRKHLIYHIKREHCNPRQTGITFDCDVVENYPSQSIGTNRNKELEMAISHDCFAQLPVGDGQNIIENQTWRFKCPVCQYLVQKVADLKAHVKHHSETGEITLVVFHCKYCSAASTAREIIYRHLLEKHLGKPIALVKRVVIIDARGADDHSPVTSMEDEELEQQDRQKIIAGTTTSIDGKQSLILPDSEGEIFSYLMPCPRCDFSSVSRCNILQHAMSQHPDLKIFGCRQNNELYDLMQQQMPNSFVPQFSLGGLLKCEVLIVPDTNIFDEPVLCPKCSYATFYRRDIIFHLESHHPEISVMGRNDYPTLDGKNQDAVVPNATGKDGMVIIGSECLDEKICCLYENFGDRLTCMICRAERPKKFFMHVHILRHLNILLWGCVYCNHRGLQKYKMVDHIKKVHPGRPFCIQYLPVNIDEKVNDYLKNASIIHDRRSRKESNVITASPMEFQSSVSNADVDSMSASYTMPHEMSNSCAIGSEELDMKLACLYSLVKDNKFRCVICAHEFLRKFAIHRHIVQSHLKVNLIGCGYCELEGVERHIMTDHILENHQSLPIHLRSLTENLENKVAEFLSKMITDSVSAIEMPVAADVGMAVNFNFEQPTPPRLPVALSPNEMPRCSSFRSNGKKIKNQPKSNLLLLGRDALHEKLKPLINPHTGLKCQICHWDFPRRYAVHRHLLMKHLKVGIIGCPYCQFEGVERYQVFSHIKEDHKGLELNLKYLDIDFEGVVSRYLQSIVDGTEYYNNKAPPPWSIKKSLKKDLFSDEGSSTLVTSPSTVRNVGESGLRVAMFRRKKLDSCVKHESGGCNDNLYGNEPQDLEVNGDGNVSNFENEAIGLGNENDFEVSSMSLHSANGTKSKVATDVQTSIRVITVKENGCKRHICEKCRFTSLHRSNIVRHIYRVHEQYREQECPACNYKTLSRVLIEHHINSAHPGMAVPIDIPRRAEKRKSDMSQEDLEFDSMKKCKAAASSKRREVDADISNSTTQLFACAYCNFETVAHDDIIQHTREKHSVGDDSADNVNAGLTSEESIEKKDAEDMISDVAKINDDDDATVDDADRMYYKNKTDTLKAMEVSLWKCHYCNYKTSNEADLKNHFSETHPCNLYRYKRLPTWRFVCHTCHVKTRAHSKMRYHLNRHINYRPYTCTTCGAFYPSPDQCRKHCRSNYHNETFTYVKIPRKERRLHELLKECQEYAVDLAQDANSNVSCTRPFSVMSKRKARKTFPPAPLATEKMRKSYEYDAPYTPRGPGGSSGSSMPLSADKVMEAVDAMSCTMCEFWAHNVCDVWLHFIKQHKDNKFLWRDTLQGFVCNETGEITNSDTVEVNLEPRPGPGFTSTRDHSFSCDSCVFSTTTVQAMKSHLRRHLPKRFICPYCSMRCSRGDTINQHVRCSHKGRQMWTIYFSLPVSGSLSNEACDPSSVAELGEGRPTEGEEEPPVTFQVEEEVEHVWSEVSSNAGSNSASVNVGRQCGLAEGVKAVMSEMERFKCSYCDVRMTSIAAILQHHCKQHSDDEFLWVDTTNNYTFTHSGEVVDAREQSPHLFSQDGFIVRNGGGGVPNLGCKYCSFSSTYIQAIKSHMKSHLPHGFLCPYCSLSTNSKDKLISHQLTMHRSQEQWIVHLHLSTDTSSLGSTSSTMAEKTSYPKRKLKPTNGMFSCKQCDYTSDNYDHYCIHLANHGSISKLTNLPVLGHVPFKCGYCVYVAKDEFNLGKHLAAHLDEKSFSCSECHFSAFEFSTIESHIQTTHDETDEIEIIDLNSMNTLKESIFSSKRTAENIDTNVDGNDCNKEVLTPFPVNNDLDNGGDVEEDGASQLNKKLALHVLNCPSALGDDDDDDDDGDNERSDSTEEWGTSASIEASPIPVECPCAPSGGSILRLTLQGKLTGEYGIKSAVPVDSNSFSKSSLLSDEDADENGDGYDDIDEADMPDDGVVDSVPADAVVKDVHDVISDDFSIVNEDASDGEENPINGGCGQQSVNNASPSNCDADSV